MGLILKIILVMRSNYTPHNQKLNYMHLKYNRCL